MARHRGVSYCKYCTLSRTDEIVEIGRYTLALGSISYRPGLYPIDRDAIIPDYCNTRTGMYLPLTV